MPWPRLLLHQLLLAPAAAADVLSDGAVEAAAAAALAAPEAAAAAASSSFRRFSRRTPVGSSTENGTAKPPILPVYVCDTWIRAQAATNPVVARVRYFACCIRIHAPAADGGGPWGDAPPAPSSPSRPGTRSRARPRCRRTRPAAPPWARSCRSGGRRVERRRGDRGGGWRAVHWPLCVSLPESGDERPWEVVGRMRRIPVRQTHLCSSSKFLPNSRSRFTIFALRKGFTMFQNLRGKKRQQ
jgi:hypothetical protein